MTDYDVIKNELANMMGCEVSALENYDSLIEHCTDSITARVRNAQAHSDSRLNTLCAVKSYYQILLANQSDNITSFKAGDISYSTDSSALDNAKSLYAAMLKDCSDIIDDGSFAFKAV